MSTSRSVTIHCDGCNEWEQGEEDETLTSLRRFLRKVGWITSTSGDYCPSCKGSSPEGSN